MIRSLRASQADYPAIPQSGTLGIRSQSVAARPPSQGDRSATDHDPNPDVLFLFGGGTVDKSRSEVNIRYTDVSKRTLAE